MPTERFSRLSFQKKQAIRDAAINEFANASFEKVSINKIIQNANISRGSFYTYFEDKQDVLNFIFEDMHNRSNAFLKEALERNEGDFFATYGQFLDFCLDMFESKELFDLTKNVFVSYRGSQTFLGLDNSLECRRFEKVTEMLEYVDTSRMRMENLEDFALLVSLATANLAITLVAFYQGEEDREKLRSQYLQGLEVLKHGALSTGNGSLNI